MFVFVQLINIYGSKGLRVPLMGLFICIWKQDLVGKRLIHYQKYRVGRVCGSCKLAKGLSKGLAGIGLTCDRRLKLLKGLTETCKGFLGKDLFHF